MSFAHPEHTVIHVFCWLWLAAASLRNLYQKVRSRTGTSEVSEGRDITGSGQPQGLRSPPVRRGGPRHPGDFACARHTDEVRIDELVIRPAASQGAAG